MKGAVVLGMTSLVMIFAVFLRSKRSFIQPMRLMSLQIRKMRRNVFAFLLLFLCLEPDQTDQICFFIISGVSIVSAPDYQCHSLERRDNICCCCEFLNSNTCMLILVNRAEEKLSVHREIAEFLTVYRVCYTPIETLKCGYVQLCVAMCSYGNAYNDM